MITIDRSQSWRAYADRVTRRADRTLDVERSWTREYDAELLAAAVGIVVDQQVEAMETRDVAALVEAAERLTALELALLWRGVSPEQVADVMFAAAATISPTAPSIDLGRRAA